MNIRAAKFSQQLWQSHRALKIGNEGISHMLVQAEAGGLLIRKPAFHVSVAQLSFPVVQECL
ncbi:hypothetical protein D3C71_2226220 [compost metagenome]